MKAADTIDRTHHPFDETCWASCLRENLTSSSYGEGLETGRNCRAPRQSLTRQTFHKIMKSGCKVEQSKLRTGERLVNLIALYCILGWRIFWTTMMQRAARAAPATLAFTVQELKLLDRLVQEPAEAAADLSVYLRKLACLGGYLARTHDPPPGNIVIWRGLSRLTEIELGYELALEIVGN